MKNNIEIYDNGDVELQIPFDGETIWLRQNEIAQLFDKNRTVITRHINNILKDDEVEQKSNVQKMHIANSDKPVAFYSLDIILAVGYRTNSSKAINFRKWSTKIIKEYLIKGYSINQKRVQKKQLNELTSTIELIKISLENKIIENDEAKGLFDIINNYAKSWSLLQSYDEDSLTSPQGTVKQKFTLEYKEVKVAIEQLKSELIKKGEATALFGNERNSALKGIIGNIYQTFGGDELIPTTEEKAGNLLYYIIKDHPFSDGNKRIGSFLLILFLSRNNLLYKQNGELRINDNALVSLALLTASSDPKQKELMVKLVVNLLGDL